MNEFICSKLIRTQVINVTQCRNHLLKLVPDQCPKEKLEEEQTMEYLKVMLIGSFNQKYLTLKFKIRRKVGARVNFQAGDGSDQI